MTNKSYFNHLCETKLFLGDFILSFSPNAGISRTHFNFEVFNIKGSFLHLFGSVILTPRCILTQIFYSDPNLCKFSPYELREWCPAIFLPYTNYLHWRKFMKVALEIYVESNPKLFS